MTDSAQLYISELETLSSLSHPGPPSPVLLCLSRLRLAQLLINNGQSIKKTVDVANPSSDAIEHTLTALAAAPSKNRYLRAQCYSFVADAHTLLEAPPFAKLVKYCELCIEELKTFYQSQEGVSASQEAIDDALFLEYLCNESKALYLHHANAHKESIETYEQLLSDKRYPLNRSQRFSSSMKLSAVLNDAHRLKAAQSLLMDSELTNLASDDCDWVRLHSARSLTYALSGDMRQALDEINAAMVRASEINLQRLGNLYIRAARFYISVDAYSNAMTLLPDYIIDESNWTGMNFDLNRLVVLTQLDIAVSDYMVAKNSLDQLTDALARCKSGNPRVEMPDYWWTCQVLHAEFSLRFNQYKTLKKQVEGLPELTSSTIRNHKLERQPMLLIFAETMPRLGLGTVTGDQLAALISGSVVDDHWNQWRATLCAARKAYSEEQFTQAVFWAKLSCTQVLSLSAPCLMDTEQRERMSARLVSPFQFLEQTLVAAGRLSEALNARTLMYRLRSAFVHAVPEPGQISAHVQLDSSIGFKVTEEALWSDWMQAQDKLTDAYAHGIDFSQAVAQSGLIEFFCTMSSLRDKNAAFVTEQSFLSSPTHDHVSLLYWQDRSQLRLTVQNEQEVMHFNIEATLAELRQQVYQLKLSLIEHQHETTVWQPLAAKLYKQLLAPAEHYLLNAKCLTISTSDVLRTLPFAALHSGFNWLLDTHSVVYSYSGSVNRKSLSKGDAVFLGTSRYQSENRNELALSPDIDARCLKKAFASTVELIDTDWTAERWRTALRKQPTVVHICCHFVYIPYRPSDSYLKLSDGRRMGIAELVEPDLWKHVDLVILATCNSALGSESSSAGGEQSLADLFLTMGVSSVIGTFQPVSDASAPMLFDHLYTAIARGESPAQALNTAQRATRTSDHIGWQAYGCWAGPNK